MNPDTAPTDVYDPPVSFRGVSKSFGEVTAVEDLTFEIPRGKITALIGANGAGKTTTLRMILGLAEPSSGEVKTFGVHPRDAYRSPETVGAVLSELGGTSGATANRELSIWAAAYGVSQSRVSAVLELVDLSDVGSRKIKDFSTGMKQRLSLATALLPDPELLVLDEPSTGLDPMGIRWLRETLRGFASEGRTVILSSHQLTQIERTVDQLIVLDRTIRFTGPLSEFVDGRDLEQRFLEVTSGAA